MSGCSGKEGGLKLLWDALQPRAGGCDRVRVCGWRRAEQLILSGLRRQEQCSFGRPCLNCLR